MGVSGPEECDEKTSISATIKSNAASGPAQGKCRRTTPADGRRGDGAARPANRNGWIPASWARSKRSSTSSPGSA